MSGLGHISQNVGLASHEYDPGMHDTAVPGSADPLSFVGMRSPSRIGRALRSARRDAGITQADLAAAASVSREVVSLMENGQRGARVETLNAVLFALGYELAFVPMAESARRPEAQDARG